MQAPNFRLEHIDCPVLCQQYPFGWSICVDYEEKSVKCISQKTIESYDDRPGNGMALCRLCHWSFDEGLMSVGREYQVIVSKSVASDRNLPGHILTLSDRNIFTPDNNDFRPHQDNFEWHRKKTFRK